MQNGKNGGAGMIVKLALIWIAFINTVGIAFGIYGYLAAKRKWIK